MTLAEKILSLRTQRGMSQDDLAEKLEVSRQSVSKWETAQSTPELDKIIKLADLFGVSVDQLVRDGKTESSKARKADRPLKRLLRWDPVWPWLETEGHRVVLACILLALMLPVSLLRLGTVPFFTLPVLTCEVLLIKRRTLALIFLTLIVAVGLTWPALGIGILAGLVMMIPVLVMYL